MIYLLYSELLNGDGDTVYRVLFSASDRGEISPKYWEEEVFEHLGDLRALALMLLERYGEGKSAYLLSREVYNEKVQGIREVRELKGLFLEYGERILDPSSRVQRKGFLKRHPFSRGKSPQ